MNIMSLNLKSLQRSFFDEKLRDLDRFEPNLEDSKTEKIDLLNETTLISLLSIKYNEQMLGVVTLDLQKDNEYYNNSLQNSSSFRLIYADRNHQKLFESLNQFGNFIIENSIDIISMAKEETAKFSEVLAVFLGLGRVVKDHPLYRKIKEKYGITDLNQVSPRIDNNFCIFLTYKPTLNNSNPPLVEIALSLANLSYQTRQIFSKDRINV